MRIETEVKLDFKDVLIRHQAQHAVYALRTSTSRASSAFRHGASSSITAYRSSPRTWTRSGTFEMARALDAFELSTALHKPYDVERTSTSSRPLSRNRPPITRWALRRRTRTSSTG